MLKCQNILKCPSIFLKLYIPNLKRCINYSTCCLILVCVCVYRQHFSFHSIFFVSTLKHMFSPFTSMTVNILHTDVFIYAIQDFISCIFNVCYSSANDGHLYVYDRESNQRTLKVCWNNLDWIQMLSSLINLGA